MKREFKPGDIVALGSGVAMRVDQDGDEFFISPIGTHWRDVRTARPLVVIDPEDSEQVERLAHEFSKARFGALPSSSKTQNAVQAALRSLVAPPKPDEPTGLGAVVEDEDGVQWVRYAHPNSTAPWCDASVSVEYDDIAAVKVLSEGVS